MKKIYCKKRKEECGCCHGGLNSSLLLLHWINPSYDRTRTGEIQAKREINLCDELKTQYLSSEFPAALNSDFNRCKSLLTSLVKGI